VNNTSLRTLLGKISNFDAVLFHLIAMKAKDGRLTVPNQVELSHLMQMNDPVLLLAEESPETTTLRHVPDGSAARQPGAL